MPPEPTSVVLLNGNVVKLTSEPSYLYPLIDAVLCLVKKDFVCYGWQFMQRLMTSQSAENK